MYNTFFFLSRHFTFLISLTKVMDHDSELNHLRLQFQALQQQQEKRKLDRKKEKETNKVITGVTQDHTDKQNDRWVLMKANIVFYIYDMVYDNNWNWNFKISK